MAQPRPIPRDAPVTNAFFPDSFIPTTPQSENSPNRAAERIPTRPGLSRIVPWDARDAAFFHPRSSKRNFFNPSNANAPILTIPKNPCRTKCALRIVWTAWPPNHETPISQAFRSDGHFAHLGQLGHLIDRTLPTPGGAPRPTRQRPLYERLPNAHQQPAEGFPTELPFKYPQKRNAQSNRANHPSYRDHKKQSSIIVVFCAFWGIYPSFSKSLNRASHGRLKRDSNESPDAGTAIANATEITNVISSGPTGHSFE